MSLVMHIAQVGICRIKSGFRPEASTRPRIVRGSNPMRADFYGLKANPDLGCNQILSCFFSENPRSIAFDLNSLLLDSIAKVGG
jgi:hypothetical protein